MVVENFYKFIKYYGKGRKLKMVGFFLLSLIAGFLEFMGIALIYPFILLIVQPQSVINTKYYQSYVSYIHVQSPLANAFIIGFFVVLLFILKNLFMIWSLYLQNKFLNNWKLAINKQFMQLYLFSSFKDSLKTTPAEKIYNLTFLTPQAIEGFIFRGINLVTNSVIVAVILTLLFVNFPIAASLTAIFVIYGMIMQNNFFKKKTKEISKQILSASMINNNKLLESINNIKEIKILSSEKYFYENYIKSQREMNNLQFKNSFYITIPPYIIETLIVLALLLLAGVISIQNIQNIPSMIASYAIVAAAIFRIAPALNRIQISLNAINSSRDCVKAMILEYEKTDFKQEEEKSGFNFEFSDSLQLKDVSFSYNKGREVIKNLNLEIKKGEFIGIIGLSGAGKSTLADIIMGLLPPDSGEILLDGVQLNEKNFSAMRKLMGYVPQQINILDASFRENVALGIEPDNINDEKVIEALENAQLFDFVQEKGGIEIKLNSGTSGLSQGQKQRLAIARALYRESEILIFDEATSSLDVETEHEITQMLKKLKGKKTIVSIAHRLSTLKNCDKLVYLKMGKVVDTGTFKELSQKHADFEKLIKLSTIDNA